MVSLLCACTERYIHRYSMKHLYLSIESSYEEMAQRYRHNAVSTVNLSETLLSTCLILLCETKDGHMMHHLASSFLTVTGRLINRWTKNQNLKFFWWYKKSILLLRFLNLT